MIGSADVRRHKPDPEGYLRAMELLGATPRTTMIFEDSGPGLAAAQASGAAVFRVEAF